MDKVKVSPGSLTDDELVDLIADHKTKMTDNANFPTPSPTAAAFDTATQPYLIAAGLVSDLEDQLKEAIADRNLKRLDAEDAILKRRDYVQTASGGSAPIILTSGFGLAGKPGGSATPPAQPTSFAASMSDHSGEVDTMWDSQRRRSFIVQYCDDPMTDTNWKQGGVTTKSSLTVKGLTSGKKYWFRACSLLGDAQSPWSDPALCMAP